MTALSMNSVTHAALFFGIAKAFTSIDPLSAAITGAIVPICTYALDTILPGSSMPCSSEIMTNTNAIARNVIIYLGAYVLGTLAANSMGYSISLTGAILLGLSSNVVFVGVAFAVMCVFARIVATEMGTNPYSALP